MAKYIESMRIGRMQDVLDEWRGGEIHFCKGTNPSALNLPAAGDILLTHPIGAGAGSVVAPGVLQLVDVDVPEATAANSGTITHSVVTKAGVVVSIDAIPSELSVTLNGSTTLTIVAGTLYDVNSITKTEGNP